VAKQFKLRADQIKPLVSGYGYCYATDMITVQGFPVRFMYREEPDSGADSGWRFFSGFESDDYANDPRNTSIYDVNTIANYDPSIIDLLDSPVGTAFEKPSETEQFVEMTDWEPTEE
jgi:hypothetical protein